MAIDEEIVQRCRDTLEALARNGERISYSELAHHLHVANQSVGKYLNVIYHEEMAAGRPDITVIPHYQESCFGKYNSRGKEPQTITVDPENPNDVRAYKKELSEVYRVWGGQPKSRLRDWLNKR